MKKNRRSFLKNIFSSLLLFNIFLISSYDKIKFSLPSIKKKKSKDLIWYLDNNDK